MLNHKFWGYLAILIISLFYGQQTLGQDTARKNYRMWWNEAYPQQPAKNPKGKNSPVDPCLQKQVCKFKRGHDFIPRTFNLRSG